MKVVNIYKEKYDIYIGRPGKGQEGFFGSPIVIGRTCPECGGIHNSKGSTIPCYLLYFTRRIREDAEFKKRIHALRGKTLGCFCAPLPCHGDVIAKYLETNVD